VIDPGELAAAFRARFACEAHLYRAPGRVNLIGEHTDYNDGFVMPIALDRDIWVAGALRTDRLVVAHSREYGETATIDLDAPAAGPTGQWVDYVRGIAMVLDGAGHAAFAPEALRRASPELAGAASEQRREQAGLLIGANLLIASDVPIGAGLSSSAALEVACGYALADLNGQPIDLAGLARAAQRAEHEFAGMHCGIMDQMIACCGRAGAALCLDTRSLARCWLPLSPDVRVVVCNTMVRHALASGEYNARRADCEAGVATLARAMPGVRALRDVTMAILDAHRADLSDRVYRRCRHVIMENERVEAAAAALSAADFASLGALMGASHTSLRDDYEVSCAELDRMVEILAALDGVYGARMTGGGFGGSAVALVEAGAEADVRRDVVRAYKASTGLDPDVWVTAAGAGVGAWTLAATPAV
jgi:galactokinase